MQQFSVPVQIIEAVIAGHPSESNPSPASPRDHLLSIYFANASFWSKQSSWTRIFFDPRKATLFELMDTLPTQQYVENWQLVVNWQLFDHDTYVCWQSQGQNDYDANVTWRWHLRNDCTIIADNGKAWVWIRTAFCWLPSRDQHVDTLTNTGVETLPTHQYLQDWQLFDSVWFNTSSRWESHPPRCETQSTLDIEQDSFAPDIPRLVNYIGEYITGVPASADAVHVGSARVCNARRCI